MDAWDDCAASGRRDGLNADDTARTLLADGASPIDAIKAIRTAFEIDLREAKSVVHRNLSRPEQAAAEQRWDAAEHALRDDA